MKAVIINRGVPGSGKSSFSKEYCLALSDSNITNKIVSSDHFFETPEGYVYDITKAGDAHATCFYNFIKALSDNTGIVVVDNTNTSEIEMYPYYLAARAYGYRVVIKTFLIDLEVSIARNIHKVPAASCAAMYSKLMSSQIPPFWNIDINESEVFDNTKDFLDVQNGLAPVTKLVHKRFFP